MKKICMAVFVLLTIISCKEKKYGAFIVSGRIEHAPSPKIYLEELPYGGEQPVILDSATLQSNGNFELRALGKEEGLYMIAIENGPEVLIINDYNNITYHYKYKLLHFLVYKVFKVIKFIKFRTL